MIDQDLIYAQLRLKFWPLEKYLPAEESTWLDGILWELAGKLARKANERFANHSAPAGDPVREL